MIVHTYMTRIKFASVHLSFSTCCTSYTHSVVYTCIFIGVEYGGGLRGPGPLPRQKVGGGQPPPPPRETCIINLFTRSYNCTDRLRMRYSTRYTVGLIINLWIDHFFKICELPKGSHSSADAAEHRRRVRGAQGPAPPPGKNLQAPPPPG